MTENVPFDQLNFSNIVIKKVYEEKLKEFNERLSEIKNPNIIYVSDLVYCPLKRLFRMQYPEISFIFEPQAIQGELIHKGLQLYLKDLGYEIEKEISEKIYINSEEFVLKGRMDAYKEGEEVIEIKTAKSSLGIPHDHHILQLKIYLSMTNISKGTLIYVSPDRIAEFPIKKDNLDLSKLVFDYLSKKYAPRWDWECKNCIFSKLCPYRLE
ncbi:MAG: CRISPR-associated protein Cas4 [Fervidicoccus sp.]